MAYAAPTITAEGLTIPTYDDILAYLIEQKQTIYGSDIYLDPDSTDYQELSVFALMLFDAYQTAQLVFNNRGPQTAIGSGLDIIVKLNGLKRNSATYSTVDVLITGTAGTVISGGVVADVSGNKWDLPDTVTIPVGGSITVTATAQEEGAISATAGTVTTISTPVAGWTSVTNASAAEAGDDEETDEELRVRQAASTATPSLSVLEGIAGSIANISGVTEVKYYENNTDLTDSNGIPSHSVAFIVSGGDSTEIAEAIAAKMTPGTGYYGSTSVTVYDDYGMPIIVQFSRPDYITIDVEIDLTALTGYSSVYEDLIKQAVVDYINGLGTGSDVLWTRVLGASLLCGVQGSETFNVTATRIAINSSSPYSPSAADIDIAFNERAISTVSNVTITES